MLCGMSKKLRQAWALECEPPNSSVRRSNRLHTCARVTGWCESECHDMQDEKEKDDVLIRLAECPGQAAIGQTCDSHRVNSTRGCCRHDAKGWATLTDVNLFCAHNAEDKAVVRRDPSEAGACVRSE